MAIRLAKTAGFCWGVRRAVGQALRVAYERGRRIFTYGPLIHNQQALDLLRTKGIERLPEDTECEVCGPVLIRAHGVAPQIQASLAARDFEVIDATCPHVARAQRIVKQQTQQGRRAIIVGDRGHAEVEGLLGHADGRGLVVESPEDVGALPADLGEVCVVAQTTQGGDRFERCVEAVRARYGDIDVFNTRCSDTNNRQRELFELASQVEAVVVVGGRGSANTGRLVELARSRNVPTWHVETADELPLAELERYEEIGVTAGASTPHWIIEQVVDRLRALQRRRQPVWLRTISAAVRLLVVGEIVLATGAAALTVAAIQIMRIDYRFEYCALAFLYLWAMHMLHRIATLPPDLSLISGPTRMIAAYRRPGLVAGVASLVGALILSAFMGPLVCSLVVFSTVVGAVYSFSKIPRGWFPRVRFRQIHDIPGSKDLCVASAWSMMIAVIPWMHAHGWSGLQLPRLGLLALTAAFVFGLILVRSVAVDLRDLEGDLMVGRETLPVVAGRRLMNRLLILVLVALAVLALGLGSLATPPWGGLYLLAPVLLMAFAHWLAYRQRIRSHLAWGVLLDLPFLVAGALSLIQG